MKFVWSSVVIVLAIVAGLSGRVLAWSHGAAVVPPCDIVTCAEAHSLTRAMTASYHGPLFQISKSGGSTLDIGQTATGNADMATWSAFCSAVQSNCWITKVYAQIHTTTNDLASYLGVTDSGAKFQIEAATGLPIAIVPPTVPFNIPGNGSDVYATGINGFGTAVSVYYVGRFAATDNQCCGVYGIYHRKNDATTPGTDFAVMPAYGIGGFAHCPTSTVYCLQIDEEQNSDAGTVSSSPVDLIGIITFDPAGSTTVKGYANNNMVFNNTPPVLTINPGTAIHLFVGGDNTQSGTAIFREGAITNTIVTSQQATTLANNARAFYPGVSFP